MKHKNKKKNVVSNKSRSSLAKLRFASPFKLTTLAIVTLLVAANIHITQDLTVSAQNVLGENEQNEEQKHVEEQQKEAEKQAEEAKEESAKKVEEQQKEVEKTTANTPEASEPPRVSEPPRTSIKSEAETLSPSGLKMKTESEGEKQETEIETADGQKIKTKIEDDGNTKIEVENGTVKLKYSILNGQVVLNVENEDGEEVEIEDEELEELENEVEDELEDDGIRLAPTADNKLALTQNQITALTDFPLSINVATKELVVTTPAGQKIITILPDEAVQNLLVTGIINSVEAPPSDVATQDQLGALTGVVKIEARDNEIVYKIRGKKTHLVLGIIPITTPVTAFVSTDTGLTVAKQQSILTYVADLLSP